MEKCYKALEEGGKMIYAKEINCEHSLGKNEIGLTICNMGADYCCRENCPLVERDWGEDEY